MTKIKAFIFYCLLAVSHSTIACEDRQSPENLIFGEKTDWSVAEKKLKAAGFILTKLENDPDDRLTAYDFVHYSLDITGGLLITPDNRIMNVLMGSVTNNKEFGGEYVNRLIKLGLLKKSDGYVYRNICNMEIALYNSGIELSYINETKKYGF